MNIVIALLLVVIGYLVAIERRLAGLAKQQKHSEAIKARAISSDCESTGYADLLKELKARKAAYVAEDFTRSVLGAR